MTIGLISGSARANGSTHTFLRKLQILWRGAYAKTDCTFVDGPNLDELPLFSPDRLTAGCPREVAAWSTFVKTSDVLIVATPEYAHGIPAALKSAMEWLVASGEFSRKRCMPVTVAPQAPRGEHCMQALTWTLKAMDADVIAELPIHASQAQLANPAPDAEWVELVEAAYEMATGEPIA